MRLLLIRRAETDSNAALRYGERDAVPLNARGQQQAERVAKRLSAIHPQALYTSDIVRAVETAQIIGRQLRCELQPMAELREIDVGAWEALTPEELYRRYPNQIQEFARDPARPVRPGGESYLQLQTRVEQALAAFVRMGDQTIVAVSHGGTIRAALRTAINVELAVFPRIALDACGITDLRWSSSGWRLHGLNDTSHLESE